MKKLVCPRLLLPLSWRMALPLSLLTLAMLSFNLMSRTAAQSVIPDGTRQGIKKIMLAEGIYQFSASFDGYVDECNSTLIISEREALVFDTNTRPSTARAILAEIRKLTERPVRYVVNSHWHPDHWSGNEVYAEAFPGLQIIATRRTRETMENVAPTWMTAFTRALKRQQEQVDNEAKTGKRADGVPLTEAQRREHEDEVRFYAGFVAETGKVQRTFPTLLYEHRLTLHLGSRELQMMSLFGDADESTVLYLPKEKILLTGDLLVHPIQWGSNSYHLTPWLNSLKKLNELEVNVIVPGHGPALRDKAYLNLYIELFESVKAQVRAALRQGLPLLAEVQQTVKLDAIRLKFTRDDPELNRAFANAINVLVRMAYREAREGSEPRQ